MTDKGNDDFADLGKLLHAALDGEATAAGDQTPHHLKLLREMNDLLVRTPEGYEELLLAKANEILQSVWVRLDIQTEAEVMAGRVLAQTDPATDESRHSAIAMLTAGFGHTLDLPKDIRTVDLLVEAGVALVVMHVQTAIAAAGDNPTVYTDPSSQAAQHAALARWHLLQVRDYTAGLDAVSRAAFAGQIDTARQAVAQLPAPDARP